MPKQSKMPLTAESPISLALSDVKALVKLELNSYGFKRDTGRALKGGYTTVPISDLVIDCRGVTERGIKGTGSDPAFQEGVQKASSKTLDAIYTLIMEAIQKIPDRRSEKKYPFDTPFAICFCCAWGVHRSVSTKHIMFKRLKASGYQVTMAPEADFDWDSLWAKV